jgi:hypothetical protein
VNVCARSLSASRGPHQVSQLFIGALLGGAVLFSSACSDDDGNGVPPKATGGTAGTSAAGAAGSGGAAGVGGTGGAAGGAGTGGTAGSGGSAGSGNSEPPDASYGPSTCDSPPDAGVDILDAGTVLLPDGGDAGKLLSFATDIHPIFNTRCVPCHETGFSGGHNIGADDINVSYCWAVSYGTDALYQIDGNGMPPSYAEPPNNCNGGLDSPGCVTTAEYERIRLWIAQGYPR